MYTNESHFRANHREIKFRRFVWFFVSNRPDTPDEKDIIKTQWKKIFEYDEIVEKLKSEQRWQKNQKPNNNKEKKNKSKEKNTSSQAEKVNASLFVCGGGDVISNLVEVKKFKSKKKREKSRKKKFDLCM